MEVPSFTQTQLDVAEIKNGYIKILEHLNERVEFITEDNDPKSIDDVVKLTGYKKKTIYNYCQSKKIPHCKKNNKLFFFKSDIIDWIKTGKVKTVGDIESENDEFFASKNKRLK
jgi:predicted DNA-binding transcriptional regulator AlpA